MSCVKTASNQDSALLGT